MTSIGDDDAGEKQEQGSPKLHEAIQTVYLHNAKQQTDETLRVFTATERGITAICNLTKTSCI